MKLWLISQTENEGWDTYDAAVVRAPDAETARNINPGTNPFVKDSIFTDWTKNQYSWCSGPEHVNVRYLGETLDEDTGVVLASYNAG